MFEEAIFEHQTKTAVLPATGHRWGEPEYFWSEDNSSVLAERICLNDSSHREEETAETVLEETLPTCTEDGSDTWTAEFVNEAFETQEKTEVLPATGHRWDTPVYTWADDYSSVRAETVCLNDSTHVFAETAKSAAKIILKPTCTEDGSIEYDAEFEEPVFEPQTFIDVIPATGHDWADPASTWSRDYSRVTAERICRNDRSHIETETARSVETIIEEPAATKSGLAEYTAQFRNPAYETQVIEVVIPPSGTEYLYYCSNGSSSSWTKGDKSSLTITFKRYEDDSLTYRYFQDVVVDGKTLDQSGYNSESGSVIIHLLPEYLETLSAGTHTLYAQFYDGASEAVKFTIKEKKKDSSDSSSSKTSGSTQKTTGTPSTKKTKESRVVNTSDRTYVTTWASIFAGSLLVCAVSLVTLILNREED